MDTKKTSDSLKTASPIVSKDAVQVPETIKPLKSSPQNLGLLISIMLLLLLTGQLLGFHQLVAEVVKRNTASVKFLQQKANSELIAQIQSKYASQLKIIDKILPSENEINRVVDKINSRLSQFPESQLRFDTNAPVLAQGDKFPFLPLTITLTTNNIVQINQLLEDLTASGLVYIPQDVDLAIKPAPENSVKAIIKGKLYVQTN